MTATRTDIVRLDEPAATERSVVGAKAAHLARAAGRGLPRPGRCRAPRLAARRVARRRGASPQVERCIEEVVASFEGVALAVRSSADAEDGTAASFAGTYATVLGATGVEEVTAAVRTCLDSADAPRLDAYRGAGGVRMSVLCQPMLDPDAAGVAFTADPFSGDTDVARISAVRGLGDRLVDGGANPDEWRVVGEVAETIPTGAEVAISADQALAVAGVAHAAAGHFGVAAGRRVGHPRRAGARAPEPADLGAPRSPRRAARRSGVGEGRGALPGAGHPVRMVGVRSGVRWGPCEP